MGDTVISREEINQTLDQSGSEQAEKEQQAVEEKKAEEKQAEEKGGEADKELSDNKSQTPASEKTGEEEKKAESWQKAYNDTKAYATRLAQENAELKKTIEAAKAGNASEKDVSDARKAVEDAKSNLDAVKKKVYEDYPELEALIEPIIRQNNELGQKINNLESEKTKNAEEEKLKSAREHFETHVKPEVSKVHPDFEDIIFKTVDGKRVVNNEYYAWANKQRPSMRVAALNSSDPQDIIMAITEFKKFKGSDEAKELKQKEEKEKKDKLVNAMSLRAGNTAIPAVKNKISDDDMSVDDWIKKRNKEKYGG